MQELRDLGGREYGDAETKLERRLCFLFFLSTSKDGAKINLAPNTATLCRNRDGTANSAKVDDLLQGRPSNAGKLCALELLGFGDDRNNVVVMARRESMGLQHARRSLCEVRDGGE